MSADRLHRPPWYRPPDSQEEETAEPPRVAGSPPVAVDAPRSWVRPAPVYYHDAPDALEVSAARTVPDDAVVSQPRSFTRPQPAPAAETDAAPEPSAPVENAAPPAAEAIAVPLTASRRGVSRRVAGALLLGAVAVVVIVVIVSRVAGSQHTAHNLALPQQVGSLPLIGDTATAAQQALTAEGWTGVAAGGYGSGQGQLLLILGRPADSTIDTSALLGSLQTPLVQQGFVFNASTAATTTTGGTTFTCGPVSAPSGQLNLCVWNDGDAAGIVIDYSGATLAQVREQTQVARAAAEH